MLEIMSQNEETSKEIVNLACIRDGARARESQLCYSDAHCL